MADNYFCSSVYTGAGATFHRCVKVYWYSENNTSNNTSTIHWSAYVQYGQNDNVGKDPSLSRHYNTFVNAKNISLTIAGQTWTLVGGGSPKRTYEGDRLGGGSITVNHNADGSKSVNVSVNAQFYSYGENNSTYSGTIKMKNNPVYNLSVQPVSGGTISVNRKSLNGVNKEGTSKTGLLPSGETQKCLCKGDAIQITATPDGSHEISSLMVNNNNFVSGGRQNVTGNITVSALFKSKTSPSTSISATDAIMNKTSSKITIQESTPRSVCYAIKLSFGSIEKYIKGDGTTQDEIIKITSKTLNFTPIYDFYAEIPNSKSGICTLTCYTYTQDGNTLLGTCSCEFNVSTDEDVCKPTIVGKLNDMNSNISVRYQSYVECKLSANAQKGSTILKRYINNTPLASNVDSLTILATTTSNVEFKVEDSRGYVSSCSRTITVDSYNPITCIASVTRNNNNESSNLSIKGTCDSSYQTNMVIQYRYKSKDMAEYPNYTVIGSSSITKSGSNYSVDVTISGLESNKIYDFQISATDGITSVIKPVYNIGRTPVFDWGADDFSFHVPVSMNNIGIMGVRDADLKNDMVAGNKLGALRDAGIYIRRDNPGDNYQNLHYPKNVAGMLEVFTNNTRRNATQTIQRFTSFEAVPTTWVRCGSTPQGSGSDPIWTEWVSRSENVADTGWKSDGISLVKKSDGTSDTSISTSDSTKNLGHNGAGIFYRIVGGNHVYVCANVQISNIASGTEKAIATLPDIIKPSKTAYSISAGYGAYIIRSHVEYNNKNPIDNSTSNGNSYTTKLYVDWVKNLANVGSDPTSISWCDIYIDYFI